MSMNFSPLIGMYLVTVMVAACSSEAAAQLSLFQNEMQAQLHCPDDAVVWLDFPKRIYYVAGQRLYAQGRTGTFVCQKEARSSGYRRSVFGRR